MKVRTGFVSNSSSSSFLVVATLDNHCQAMASLDEFQQGMIGKIMKGSTVFGQQMMVGQIWDAHGEGTLTDMVHDMTLGDEDDLTLALDKEDESEIDYLDEAYKRVSAAWDEYVGALKEHPDEVFTSWNDF